MSMSLPLLCVSLRSASAVVICRLTQQMCNYEVYIRYYVMCQIDGMVSEHVKLCSHYSEITCFTETVFHYEMSVSQLWCCGINFIFLLLLFRVVFS